MSYEKQTWEDLPSQISPFSAERMNHIEEGLNETNNKIHNYSVVTNDSKFDDVSQIIGNDFQEKKVYVITNEPVNDGNYIQSGSTHTVIGSERLNQQYGYQLSLSYNGIKFRTKYANVWSDWEDIPSNPERANINLENSWIAHAGQTPQIYKNANMLHISLVVKEGTGTLIAMLPEGFRPKNTIFVPATNLFKNSGTLINIQSDGQIVCESGDIGGLLTLNATLVVQ